jgi:hypothetical protein
MNWIHAHQDMFLFAFIIVSFIAGMWVGAETSYQQGLEDGFKDGVIEGEKH